MTESDEKTRVTAIVQKPAGSDKPKGNDCLVVIYTKEPTLLGKRFVLDCTARCASAAAPRTTSSSTATRVSRRHAHFEQRGSVWWAVDDGSTNGTYVNDEQIVARARRSRTATASRSARPSSSTSPAPTSRRSTTKKFTG